jgi:hypothetical protein
MLGAYVSAGGAAAVIGCDNLVVERPRAVDHRRALKIAWSGGWGHRYSRSGCHPGDFLTA